MDGTATAVAGGRTRKKKNKSDGVFLKQRRRHLRRWRFARNGRRAKRRKHREARSRREYPWRWAYTTRRGRYIESGAEEPTRKSDQQYFYHQRFQRNIQKSIGLDGLVYKQGENERSPYSWPTLSVMLCFLISMGIMAFEVYEIGLGIVHGAASIVMAGLGILAKLPWIVLKYLLRKLNDYILTPPAMEERSKSKLHFQLYMFCLPFLPCWASAISSHSHSTLHLAKCSKCKVQQDWSAIPISSDQESCDFCVMRCPRTECQDDVVKCNHCSYNFPLNDSESLGRRRESKDGRIRRMMKLHMMRLHSSSRIPTLHSRLDDQTEHEASDDMECEEDVFYDCNDGGGGSFFDDSFAFDASDTDPETEASEDELLEMFAFLMESTIYEKEEEEAEAYVGQFRGSDLDPNTPGADELKEREKGEEKVPDHSHLHHVVEPGQYRYSDFDFLDRRREEEKAFRQGSARDRLCQTQLYFYQKYRLQLLNKNDGTGGFAGLSERAISRNREDSSNPYYGRYVEWIKEVNLETENNGMTGATTAGNPQKELRQMHRMLTLLMNLSEPQKKDLLEFHKTNLDIFNIESVPNNIKFYYPTNWQDARAIMLDGAHSILKNFPVPRVFEISGHKDGLMNTNCGHACVGLEETLLLAAGHGARFNFNYDPRREDGEKLNNEGLNGTPAMWDLKKDIVKAMKAAGQSDEEIARTSIGYIYFWSDAFLRCFVKQKDNSVWVLTVTICPHESDKATGANTYILAMGRSGKEVDHSRVIDHYVKECQGLMKGFDVYFGDTNEIGRMAVGMLAWNADRPERQSISNTRQEGIYGKIVGWSANVSEEKFPACIRCHRKRVLEMLGGSEEGEDQEELRCTQCLDWTLDKNESNEDQKTDKPSKDYPKESEDGRVMNDAPPGRLPGQGWLGPIKLTTGWMIKALKTAYNGRRHGRWNKETTRAYLQSCNVGPPTFERVVNLASEDLTNKEESEPEDYVPPLWSLVDCFSRFRLPDLPMHGLAHGIIPDVMDIIDTVLKCYSLGVSYYKFGNKTMEDVASFRLDWCKLKSLPKAAWVSENCMAHMRLMSYIYGMFFSNFKLSTEETEHTRETVSSLKRLVNALQALMSLFMSTEVPDKRDIDNHMKLFMSSADLLHRQHGSLVTNKPKGKKGKLVDLLSAQELIRILHEFGVSERTVENATPAALRNRVDCITVNDLRTKCSNFRLGTVGLKQPLQKRVFEHILERSIVEETQTQGQDQGQAGRETETQGQGQAGGETETQEDQPGSEVDNEDQGGENSGERRRPNDKTMCWNKGNWLSFLANISDQILYLGPLTWIW